MPTPTLGKCCECERDGPEVRNMLMLHFRSPEPGFGCWGCLICGLDTAGAIAVLCNECMHKGLDNFKIPKYACLGPPAANRRIPVEQLTEPFAHDESKHAEAEEAMVHLLTPSRELIEEVIDEIIAEAMEDAKNRKKANQRNGGNGAGPRNHRNPSA